MKINKSAYNIVWRVCFFSAVCLLSACSQKKPALQKVPVPKFTVNDPTDANTTWRTGKPLSYQEAIQNGHCPIPLPKEAKHIEFVDFYAGFGGFSQYVRFEAPIRICKEHAQQNSKLNAESPLVQVTSLRLDPGRAQSVAQTAKTGEIVSQAPWFDSDAIQNGEAWGRGDSHTPEIFIDLDRGVFYHHCSD